MNFKVGDTVRCINKNNYAYVEKNSIYTICKVGDRYFGIEGICDGKDYYSPEHFEIFSTKTVMTGKEALQALLDGKKIRQKGWIEKYKNNYLHIVNSNLIDTRYDKYEWLVTSILLGEDWELYTAVRLSDLKPGQKFRVINCVTICVKKNIKNENKLTYEVIGSNNIQVSETDYEVVLM